jgi:hypothetical protein
MALARRLTVALLVSGILCTACAGASQHPAVRVASRADITLAPGSPTTLAAESPQWQAEGQRLRATKNSQAASPSGYAVLNSGDYAYESGPIDITGDGPYTLSFSPVDATFNPSQVPFAIAFEIPPDAGFRVALGPASVSNVNGVLTASVPITVRNFTRPYSQFTMWIY